MASSITTFRGRRCTKVLRRANNTTSTSLVGNPALSILSNTLQALSQASQTDQPILSDQLQSTVVSAAGVTIPLSQASTDSLTTAEPISSSLQSQSLSPVSTIPQTSIAPQTSAASQNAPPPPPPAPAPLPATSPLAPAPQPVIQSSPTPVASLPITTPIVPLQPTLGAPVGSSSVSLPPAAIPPDPFQPSSSPLADPSPQSILPSAPAPPFGASSSAANPPFFLSSSGTPVISPISSVRGPNLPTASVIGASSFSSVSSSSADLTLHNSPTNTAAAGNAEKSSKTPTVAIAVGTIGGLAALVVVGLIIFFCLKRRKARAGNVEKDTTRAIGGGGLSRSGSVLARARAIGRKPLGMIVAKVRGNDREDESWFVPRSRSSTNASPPGVRTRPISHSTEGSNRSRSQSAPLVAGFMGRMNSIKERMVGTRGRPTENPEREEIQERATNPISPLPIPGLHFRTPTMSPASDTIPSHRRQPSILRVLNPDPPTPLNGPAPRAPPALTNTNPQNLQNPPQLQLRNSTSNPFADPEIPFFDPAPRLPPSDYIFPLTAGAGHSRARSVTNAIDHPRASSPIDWLRFSPQKRSPASPPRRGLSDRNDRRHRYSASISTISTSSSEGAAGAGVGARISNPFVDAAALLSKPLPAVTTRPVFARAGESSTSSSSNADGGKARGAGGGGTFFHRTSTTSTASDFSFEDDTAADADRNSTTKPPTTTNPTTAADRESGFNLLGSPGPTRPNTFDWARTPARGSRATKGFSDPFELDRPEVLGELMRSGSGRSQRSGRSVGSERERERYVGLLR
ncbi:hypothetical protein K402DRAFT_98950 [Aulographum hederae CBS 113979]|uniref:Uncharacterized protein n=1 Tax=Aulographum hederae CBS 113979 TaxID=1176131 RepID=A0A6G1GXM7_9PEZI|nr:hypothetical protein K402DRAFT_98950 [Aulographum hederae CBS 113979]